MTLSDRDFWYRAYDPEGLSRLSDADGEALLRWAREPHRPRPSLYHRYQARKRRRPTMWDEEEREKLPPPSPFYGRSWAEGKVRDAMASSSSMHQPMPEDEDPTPPDAPPTAPGATPAGLPPNETPRAQEPLDHPPQTPEAEATLTFLLFTPTPLSPDVIHALYAQPPYDGEGDLPPTPELQPEEEEDLTQAMEEVGITCGGLITNDAWMRWNVYIHNPHPQPTMTFEQWARSVARAYAKRAAQEAREATSPPPLHVPHVTLPPPPPITEEEAPTYEDLLTWYGVEVAGRLMTMRAWRERGGWRDDTSTATINRLRFHEWLYHNGLLSEHDIPDPWTEGSADTHE